MSSVTTSVLYTVGYQGGSVEALLARLNESNVQLLIDVRDLPLSRKPGLSKRSLAARLASDRIGYLHLKGLGDPKPGRMAAREGRMKEFRRIFTSHLATEVAQVDLIRGIVAAQERPTCLLCYERDHIHCHRCIVAEEMAQRGGFQLQHLVIEDAVEGRSASDPRCAHAGVVEAFG